jgi:CheY-like chemotaxis protein
VTVVVAFSSADRQALSDAGAPDLAGRAERPVAPCALTVTHEPQDGMTGDAVHFCTDADRLRPLPYHCSSYQIPWSLWLANRRIRMPPLAPESAVANVLIVNDDPDAAGDLRDLLKWEGVSAQVLTLDALGTPDAASAWMVQLDPSAIVVDIVAPGDDCWRRLIGLQEAATRQHVPFVMTTRSKHLLDVPVGTTRVIEVANHDGRGTLAACIARLVVPSLGSES